MILKKPSLIIILLAVIVVISALFLINSRYKSVIVNIPRFSHNPAVQNDINVPVSQSEILYPKSVNLSVPFTPQAPTANWDELHNEACEEASAIMSAEYFSGNENTKLASELVEEQITKLTEWQQKTFGYYLSISSEETVQMIEANYNLKAKIITDVTEENIKNELSQNHLILFPANGQLLGNPNYKRPGPKYHMLVIRGYTASSIITNDPGTRNGLNYPYDFDTLYNANGNWNHQTEKVDLSKKNMVVVWE